MSTLRGVIVASLTPYKRGDGGVDVDAAGWLAERFAEAGLTGVLVSGTTGEWMLLRDEERLRLFEAFVSAVGGRVKILAGVMRGDVESTVSLARRAADVGVDYLVATPPIYFRASPSKLRDYYLRLADRTDKPVIVYTIPSKTGYNIPVEVVREIALEHSGIAGIKATVDDLHYVHELVVEVKTIRPDFSVLAGYGEYLLDTLVAGGDGAVDAVANLVPKLPVAIYEAWTAGDTGRAAKLHRALTRLAAIVRRGRSLQSLLKTVLSRLGAPIEPAVRPPLESEDADRVEFTVALLCTAYRDYLAFKPQCLE